MKLKRFLSAPVLSVIILVGFVYYMTIFVFIEDWIGLQSSAGLLNSLIFTALASLCVFSFMVCVLEDPGGVPSGYLPDVEVVEALDHEIKRNVVVLRNCDKCSTYKPPRAHHCRVCRRCVLRMDHHCTWINNCVGHRNHKAFLLLVFYAAAACTYSAIIIICCIIKDWATDDSLTSIAFRIGIGLWIIALSLTLGTLLIWNIYLSSHNMTTIEYQEGKRAAWLARKSGLSYHHPYDVGVYKNATLVSPYPFFSVPSFLFYVTMVCCDSGKYIKPCLIISSLNVQFLSPSFVYEFAFTADMINFHVASLNS